MGAALEITLEDLRLEERIKTLAREAATGQRLMTELSVELLGQTEDRFVKEQAAPDGTPWERSERAKRQGDRGKTLIDTGLFKNSMINEATETEAVVGSNAVQAAIHQLGGTAGSNESVTLPERPYLGVSKKNLPDLEDVVLAHWERLQ